MKLKAIIVDDEMLDTQLLENLINKYCTHIHVQKQLHSINEAITYINTNKPHVVFLDIQMRGETGFELLEQVTYKNFLTIFTTGYNEYGIQAIKAGAFDYLLKPIDIDELLIAETKIMQYANKTNIIESPALKIYHQGAQIAVKPTDIVLMRAQGSYTRIFLIDNQQIMVAKNLRQLADELFDDNFIKVHRSTIINTKYIKSYKPMGNAAIITLINNEEVSVSRSFKSLLKNILP